MKKRLKMIYVPGCILVSSQTEKKCTRLKTNDTWYDPHTYDSDDSDMTINFSDKFPDEETSTWITTKNSTVQFITTVVNKLIAPK